MVEKWSIKMMGRLTGAGRKRQLSLCSSLSNTRTLAFNPKKPRIPFLLICDHHPCMSPPKLERAAGSFSFFFFFFFQS